jgi:hypothetical protein
MRSALLCGITQRRMVILYRRFGTTYWSHLQGSTSSRRNHSSWKPDITGRVQLLVRYFVLFNSNARREQYRTRSRSLTTAQRHFLYYRTVFNTEEVEKTRKSICGLFIPMFIHCASIRESLEGRKWLLVTVSLDLIPAPAECEARVLNISTVCCHLTF